jgi:very-short-patch-repair endonuclease
MQNIILNKINNIIKTSKPDGVVTRLKHNEQLWTIILDFTKNFNFKNKAEQVYFYSQQFTNKPVCKCGKPLTFVSITLGYREFCSRSCEYAKTAALDRRVSAMKLNGGVGLANPATYLKAKGKLQEKHGTNVTNPGQIKSHIQNMTVNNPMFLEENKKKLKITFEEKYGKDRFNPGQRNCTDIQMEILTDINKFSEIVKGKSAVTVANETGLNHSTIMRRAHKFNLLDTMIYKPQSAMEHDLKIWLDSKGINYQRHNRSILPNNYELDFYFPQWNFAVELHGLFHHAELASNKDKTYHSLKYKGCQINNIQLLQIWQDEYWQHKEVVQSKILYLANLITNKIPARKCKLIPLNNIELERGFMNRNHIQGHADYRQWSLGAWFNDQLVSVMAFSNQMNRLELVRYATKIDSVASGLFSKMFKKSIEEFNFTGNIISLSDNRISNGRLYLNSGFSNLEELNPGYCYTNDYVTRIHRQGVMKNKLIKKHNLDPDIAKTMTEWELAQELGYDRLWDAGKIKWIYEIE